MSPYPDETRPRVFHGKPVLCEGEAAKVVVELPERLRGVGVPVVLIARDWQEQPSLSAEPELFIRPLRPESELLRPRAATSQRFYYQSGVLDAGGHTLRVYFAPPSVADALPETYADPGPDTPLEEWESVPELSSLAERLERYLVDERHLRVATFEAYRREALEMFGEEWDEPIYLDRLNAGRLEELFDGWSLRRPPRPAQPAGRIFLPEDPYAAAFLHGLRDIVAEFMRAEVERLPFDLSLREYSAARRLPRVDLSKFMWVLGVLSPTWAHLLLGHEGLHMSVSADEGGLLLDLRGAGAEPERRMAGREIAWEPPLFGIVRQAAADSFLMSLSYDPARGVRFNVRPEETLNTGSGDFMPAPRVEPGSSFSRAEV